MMRRMIVRCLGGVGVEVLQSELANNMIVDDFFRRRCGGVSRWTLLVFQLSFCFI